jgi:hypothetical protein
MTTAACTARGWRGIAGVELDEPEDISDFERLMNPATPVRSAKVHRNEPCPCSGKKYKRCCADKEARGGSRTVFGRPFSLSAGQLWRSAGRIHALDPLLRALRVGRMVCGDIFAWRTRTPEWGDPEAASAVAHKHLEAAFARGGDGTVENFAMSLKDAGYVRMSDFRRALGADPDFSPL